MKRKPPDFTDFVELAKLKREVKNRIRGRGPAPRSDARAYFGRAKHAKDIIKKIMLNSPRAWRPPLVGADMLAAQYRQNPTLDSLVPTRKALWVPPLKRRKTGETVISQFSFLDNPSETLEGLRSIALNDATLASYLLHFELERCEDVSPFIVLGLMREGMTPAADGGRLTEPVAQMIEAVGLKRFLRMNVLSAQASRKDELKIWPLPLQTKEPGNAKAESQAFGAQRKEKVTDAFVGAIDDWLYEARTDDSCYQLTKHGKATIAEIFSELLDNAERHTIRGDDRGGGWRVAGFMARRGNTDAVEFICNISIVSLGLTIGESLKLAEDPMVAAKLAGYCAKHRKMFGNDDAADDLLRTVCALQDRVSRVAQTGTNPHGGVGIMDMIDVVNELGRAPIDAIQPQVTIYSGTACIMVRAPYSRGKQASGDPNSPRTLWLNAANSLEIAPDSSHVFKGPLRFPGTIVTARFGIDEKYLSSVGVDNG